MRILISESYLRNVIKSALVRSLREEYVRGDVPDEIYDSLAIKFERFGITTYSSYWLAAAAIAWANHDDNNFVISIFNSISTGGLSAITREKNGQTFRISLTAEQASDLNDSVKRRLRFLKDLNREDLVPKLEEQYKNFLASRASPLTLSPDEIQAIEAHTKSLGSDTGLVTSIQKIISNTTDPGKILSNTMARAILESPSKLGDILGSLICVVEPEEYKNLTDAEKAALASAEAKEIDPFTGETQSTSYMLQGEVFESLKAPPQAEVIAVQTKNTAQPIAIVNVFKTLLKSFADIQSENKALFNNEHPAAWAGQYVQPSTVTLDDVFKSGGAPGDGMNLNANFKFNPVLEQNNDFKKSMFDILSATEAMDPNSQFEASRLLKIDLRAITYPSKIFTKEGQETASQFVCPVDSVGEAIALGWQQNENDDLSAVCKVYIADSLSANLGLALVQFFQAALLEIVGGFVGAALGGPPGAVTGTIAGKIVNAYAVVAENLATQILPLVNGSMYFWAKGNTDAAAALLGRAVVQVMFTILQVGAQEFGAMVKSLPQATIKMQGKLAAEELEAVFRESAGATGAQQLAGLIGGVLIDVFLSLQVADALNPGSKDIVINSVKSFFTGAKMDEESLRAVNERMKARVQSDVLKINALYTTYEQMTLADRYKTRLRDIKIKDN